MTTNGGHDLKVVLSVDFPGGMRLGRGKVQLLGLIRETGSISAAGRAMDMSYRRAWLLVDALNHMFHQPVVESQRGGKQGGGAALTRFGEDLLARMHAAQATVITALDADLAWLKHHSAAGTATEAPAEDET
ncbi:winged helix-turn-helix domain-containing protein [Neorhizobium sp. NPDC001467]|uniref:winged helix-turn-helix domain-containing protein n=1 Tax=Neorhizobium sp. NPDC001467 TaxID=3390595 RepID=UPI003D080354